mgnify:FL=1
MTDREITALGKVLKENYHFDPVIIYGTGAISFRNVMITFFWNGKIKVKSRILLGSDVMSLLNAMVSINLIRQAAVQPLLEQFYKRLNDESNE